MQISILRRMAFKMQRASAMARSSDFRAAMINSISATVKQVIEPPEDSIIFPFWQFIYHQNGIIFYIKNGIYIFFFLDKLPFL